MSIKGKARIAMAEALQGVAKVRKIRGQLHVLRVNTSGRARDWQRTVARAAKQAIPSWAMSGSDDRLATFYLGKGRLG